jgi:hypothetical protein
MVSDIDIYRSANLLISQHGEDAVMRAAMAKQSIAAIDCCKRHRRRLVNRREQRKAWF